MSIKVLHGIEFCFQCLLWATQAEVRHKNSRLG